MLPGRIRSALFGALALVGCDGGAVQVAPGDAFVVDAQPGADGAMPDARPAPDAAVYDARPLTDAEPDAMPDAAPDATPDAAPDAAPADERGDWQARAVYLLMVDRFANGAPDPGPEDTCFDPANPRKFHGGDLVGLRERLDYFEALGVDAIWVTPLTEQVPQHGEECGYHGYWAALRAPDDGAIEPRLGTADDLDDLLDAMHARGQRLILDMVVNHAGYDAPIVETHPEWFHPRAGCEQLGDPDETCPLANLPDFDQDRDDVARYLIDASLGWVTRHAIDGIRVDTVKHVPLSFFADDWLPALRAARPEIHVVGEVFDAGPYPTQVPYLDAGFDALFDFRLRQALVDGLARVGDLDPAAVRVQEAFNSLGPTRARLRNLFLENHDVPRFASEITTDDAGEAVDRYHLALAVLMTTPGTPQLYAGTELGMIGRWPENRRDHPAWAFDGPAPGARPGYLGDPAETFALTADLLRLRREITALHAGDYAELWRPGGSGVPLYAFHRRAGESRVIVALYGGALPLVDQRLPLTTNPGLAADDRNRYADDPALIEQLGRAAGATATIEDGALHLSLPPRSASIWTLR